MRSQISEIYWIVDKRMFFSCYLHIKFINYSHYCCIHIVCCFRYFILLCSMSMLTILSSVYMYFHDHLTDNHFEKSIWVCRPVRIVAYTWNRCVERNGTVDWTSPLDVPSYFLNSRVESAIHVVGVCKAIYLCLLC